MYLVVVLLLAGVATPQFNPQELLKEAVTAQQSGDLEKAIADYRLLIAKYPNIPEIHSNLGARPCSGAVLFCSHELLIHARPSRPDLPRRGIIPG